MLHFARGLEQIEVAVRLFMVDGLTFVPVTSWNKLTGMLPGQMYPMVAGAVAPVVNLPGSLTTNFAPRAISATAM